ncbi:DUF3618 domain-containing protein [Streptomyces spectabilis]|uniref:DUF3618 domain-containing protein n=1 Tax=Streptomyces spectabilis TaxID=68270 RepID=A0A5P2XG76_STRST|nr:DUF3618 domain-containing protein [Streptomyces spectabilis]MBB5102121.1 ElaB/YqjD/DUF883 family membrane-anchored ribosome-binding protein [Streptomyces spectabilis]MCI3907170.1 DUF3618 domain-containing protein [Streptomyces spectabilis]QEV63923.1 DUF3618 domain-containing protein [Streptomyces spectabilis]GGV28890.1 hypothetical protein GCM10010245_46950 [Streptomyces spectabilis]
MGSTPDRLRQETEDTRAHLSDSVDRLAERLSPPRVARRRASAVRARATTARDRVMGTAQATARQTGDTAGQARAQAQGSPLAAGAIAFGAGLLVGALFPPTDAETRVGQRVRDHADDVVGPVRETAREATREAGAKLREPAREAASSVKDTAQEAARSTGREARTSE